MRQDRARRYAACLAENQLLTPQAAKVRTSPRIGISAAISEGFEPVISPQVGKRTRYPLEGLVLKKQLLIAVSILILGAAAFAAVDYPVPPQNAIVFNNAQDKLNTGVCSGANCAGGSGSGAAWIAPFQTTPSVSGHSVELYNAGSGFDTLWYWHLGSQNQATHLEFEFSLRVDSNSLIEAQAFENGPQQYVNGYKYSMTMQCEGPKQLWRVWDQAARGWKATPVACPHWTPNVWHKVQMYITTNHTNHTETYHTLIVDGKAYPLEITVGVTNVNFGNNLGFQFQIDNKLGSSGPGIHEWLDDVNLTVW
jgi:hypothetical protein